MHLGFPKIAYPGNPCLSVPGNLCHSFPQLHRSPALPHPCATAPVASFSRSPLYLPLGCFQYFTMTNNAARITIRIGLFLLLKVFLQGTVLEVGFLGQTVNTYICLLAGVQLQSCCSTGIPTAHRTGAVRFLTVSSPIGERWFFFFLRF